MKKYLFMIFALLATNGCQTAEVAVAKSYRVEIPHFTVEFLVPPELKRGYGPFRTEVVFEKPANPQFTFSFGDGTYRKDIGSVFLGVRGDFRDWDQLINFFVINIDRTERSTRSVEELASFARNILAKKYLLSDGKEVDDLGDVEIEKIGPHEVVIATRADRYRFRTEKIKGGGDEKISRGPYQLYYVRLDDEVALGVRVSHDNERKLNPAWFAQSHARVAKIIESMKVSQRPNQAPEPTPGSVTPRAP